MNAVTNTGPHDYFLRLSGEEFFNALIAEANLLDEKLLSKGHLEVSLGWKPISNK